MYNEYFTTINDAWNYFEALHGSGAPLRSRDELHSKVHDYTNSYGPHGWHLDAPFWDNLFDSGWALA